MRFAALLLALTPLESQELPAFFFDSGRGIVARSPQLAARFDRGLVEINGVSIRFSGSDAAPRLQGKLGASANLLVGKKPEWKTELPLYGHVVYDELYNGISASYGGSGRWLKAEYIVAPGADPATILLKFEQAPFVDAAGWLVVRTTAGEFREAPPLAWQDIDGVRRFIGAEYKVVGAEVGFQISHHDRARPLVIDPVITFGTYLGGNRIDAMTGVSVDNSGNAYVCGYTDSADMPLSAAMQGAPGGSVDAFVAKLNPSGALVYATYIGGAGDDRAFGIGVDASGNAHITGWTGSTNFPTAQAIQPALAGTRDAFVTKLNAAGTGLAYSTYFGGSGNDSGNAIAIDQWNNAFIAGNTSSTNLMTAGLFGPAQNQNRGGQDAFVTKFSVIGTVLYSTYLGGSGTDQATAVVVRNETPYVTGSTTSPDFPRVNAYQNTRRGGQDAFVTRVSYYGNVFWYSTYLGGSAGATGSMETGYAIAVDGSNAIYAGGTTSSPDFPTAAPFQTAHGGGGQDGFITKIASSGTSLVWSTFLGGTGADAVRGLSVDSSGQVIVAGETASGNFPLGSPVQLTKSGVTDAFASKLNSTGSALLWSTFYGGSGADRASGLAINGSAVWLAGQTSSADFPVLSAAQTFGLGEANGFLVKFTDGPGGSPSSTNISPGVESATPSTIVSARQTVTAVVSDGNGYPDIRTIRMLVSGTAAEELFTCQIQYNAAENRLYLLDDVNFPLGPAVPGSRATLENGQCRLSAANSGATGTGEQLTLHLDLTIKSEYAGNHFVFVAAEDGSGSKSGWKHVGVWNQQP